MINKKKYILVFVITCAVFVFAFSISNYFADQRVADIKSTEDKISIDIESSETQFELLQESSCAAVNGSILSDELDSLADKLAYSEAQHGANDPDVQTLKQYYSLLEIKDFLLMKQIFRQCNATPIAILYFYSNKSGDCPDCIKQGYVLDQLREDHPSLRIYSFDYDLDSDAVKTLISLYKIPSKLPALVINDNVYAGFQDADAINRIIPALATLDASTTAATSTTSTAPTKSAAAASSTAQ
jgi:hypothetical protein